MQNVLGLFSEGEEERDESANASTDYSLLGRYAEFVVCAELTRLGYYVVHLDAPGFDLILVVGEASLRIQVKSTSIVRQGRCVWRCRRNTASSKGNDRKRPLGRGDADIVALYHHELGKVLFVPVDDASSGTIELSAAQVQSTDTAHSLKAALVRVMEWGGI